MYERGWGAGGVGGWCGGEGEGVERVGGLWPHGVGRAIPAPSAPFGARSHRATKIANELAVRGNLSRWEHDYLDVLSDLIEAYEAAHHPIPDLSGPEMLRHLLTERGISQASAAREMGMAPSTVSDILRGKRGIGRKHIEAFATYFHVSPAVFLPEP